MSSNKKIVIKVLAYTLLLLLLPLFLAGIITPFAERYKEVYIPRPWPSFESPFSASVTDLVEFNIQRGIAIKYAYHPELSKRIHIALFSGGLEDYSINLGYFIKIRLIGDEVKVYVEGKLINSSKLLEGKAILNLMIKGYSFKLVVARCHVPDLSETKFSYKVREEILKLFNESLFTTWLRRHKFNYKILDVRPLAYSKLPEKLEYRLIGGSLKLEIEGLEYYCYVYFDEPYIFPIGKDIPKEILVTPEEREKYYGEVIFVRSHGSSHHGFSPLSPFLRQFLQQLRQDYYIQLERREGHVFPRLWTKRWPFIVCSKSRSINVTKEHDLMERIFSILRRYRVLEKLLEICDIERVCVYKRYTKALLLEEDIIRAERAVIILTNKKLNINMIKICINLLTEEIRIISIHLGGPSL